MNKTYILATINDLLRVPSERRSACLREIGLALQSFDAALQSNPGMALGSIEWADDGKEEFTAYLDGEDLRMLR